MTKLIRLEELADRCEAASGPDRELDASIAAALRICPSTPGSEWVANWDGPFIPNPRHAGNGRGRVALQNGSWWESANVTASLDAAMTLVPEGAFWRLGHDGDGADPSEFKAQLIVPMLGGNDPRGDAIASTPALALCAAALRSLAQHKGDSNG